MRVPRLTVAVLVVLGPAAARAATPGPVQFNRDVRPILSDKCFFCHGPDKNHRKSGLRLDERQGAVDSGAIVPGKPDESEVWKRLTTKDADDVMPPPDTHKTVTAAERDVLRRWITEGAPYQAHWAYVPIAKPAVPTMTSPTWARTPVDAFVLATLQARTVTPSQDADKRTLFRRLSLDLIGLPPTPEEARAFANDTRPDAYERQVDRLLGSPHFGERMAVPWLDVVRFTDTVGYHGDQNQHVFPYRDYVINAFNSNKPFDQFTIEQLAGDLLPSPSTEQLVATGFNRLNMATREGGAQPKEYLAKYMGDRVRTVGAAWLGSTVGCAECHDHKYDPIATKDFYSLGAFFADVKQFGVYADYAFTPNAELKGFTNDHPFPPEISVPSPYLQRRAEKALARAKEKAAEADKAISGNAAARKRMEAWTDSTRGFLTEHPDGWQTVVPKVVATGKDAGPVTATVTTDGIVILRGRANKEDTQRLSLPAQTGGVASLRLELLPRPEHGGRIAREGITPDTRDTAPLQVEVHIERKGETGSTRAEFAFGEATYKEPRYNNGDEKFGIADGWRFLRTRMSEPQTGVYQLARPLYLDEGDALTVVVKGQGVGAFRISTSPFATFTSAGAPTELLVAAAALDPGQAARVARKSGGRAARLHYLFSTSALPSLVARMQDVDRELRECRGGQTPTMVTQAAPPLTTRVLPRGNWQDESGEVVLPAVPHFLPQPKNNSGERLTRLDLGKWLVARDNPLTARVVVNRLWKQFFGTGLSAVLNDVGAQGEPPSHPELLDWLAADFIDNGWNIKRLVKLLVMSSVYRQSAVVRPEVAEVDPNNRLLARQSARRLDAEFVRDNVLSIAGLLQPDIGGPSVKPYQPDGYWDNLMFPARKYVANTDERQHRRGVYVHWQRTFLHPMLANFDAPSREECTADRPSSNTPQQALTLLNDPTFVESSRVFAARVLRETIGNDDARLDAAFERAVGRPPKSIERDGLRAFLGTERERYGADPSAARALIAAGVSPGATGVDPAEHAAWTAVCRVLLNLQETMTRY